MFCQKPGHIIFTFKKFAVYHANMPLRISIKMYNMVTIDGRLSLIHLCGSMVYIQYTLHTITKKANNFHVYNVSTSYYYIYRIAMPRLNGWYLMIWVWHSNFPSIEGFGFLEKCIMCFLISYPHRYKLLSKKCIHTQKNSKIFSLFLQKW